MKNLIEKIMRQFKKLKDLKEVDYDKWEQCDFIEGVKGEEITLMTTSGLYRLLHCGWRKGDKSDKIYFFKIEELEEESIEKQIKVWIKELKENKYV